MSPNNSEYAPEFTMEAGEFGFEQMEYTGEDTGEVFSEQELMELKNLATAGVVRFVDNLQIINGLPPS